MSQKAWCLKEIPVFSLSFFFFFLFLLFLHGFKSVYVSVFNCCFCILAGFLISCSEMLLIFRDCGHQYYQTSFSGHSLAEWKPFSISGFFIWLYSQMLHEACLDAGGEIQTDFNEISRFVVTSLVRYS